MCLYLLKKNNFYIFLFYYSDNQKIMQLDYEDDVIFDVVTKQKFLLDTYEITNFLKWVCLHCTIDVSLVKVSFLFQSFLVLTVVLFR